MSAIMPALDASLACCSHAGPVRCAVSVTEAHFAVGRSNCAVVGLGAPLRKRNNDPSLASRQRRHSSGIIVCKAASSGSNNTDYEVFVRIGDGDSLQRLASAFRCEPRDFINANADIIAKNGDLIYEGDLLRVPFFAWKGVTPPGFQGRIVTRPIKKSSSISSLQQQFSKSVQASTAAAAQCIKGKEGVLVAILGGVLALVGAAAVARKRIAGPSGISGSPPPTGSQDLQASSQEVDTATAVTANSRALASASSVESNGASSVAAAVSKPSRVASVEKNIPAPASSSPISEVAKPAVISSVNDAVAATSLTSRPFSIKATHGTAGAAQPVVPVDDLLLPPKEPVATRKRILPWLAQADAGKNDLPAAASEAADGETVASGATQSQAAGESKWNQAQETVKASLPALALGLGGISSVALGVDGGLQAIGLTAVASFVASDLIWGSKRRELWNDLTSIRSPDDVAKFLEKRRISPK